MPQRCNLSLCSRTSVALHILQLHAFGSVHVNVFGIFEFFAKFKMHTHPSERPDVKNILKVLAGNGTTNSNGTFISRYTFFDYYCISMFNDGFFRSYLAVARCNDRHIFFFSRTLHIITMEAHTFQFE